MRRHMLCSVIGRESTANRRSDRQSRFRPETGRGIDADHRLACVQWVWIIQECSRTIAGHNRGFGLYSFSIRYQSAPQSTTANSGASKARAAESTTADSDSANARAAETGTAKPAAASSQPAAAHAEAAYAFRVLDFGLWTLTYTPPDRTNVRNSAGNCPRTSSISPLVTASLSTSITTRA